MKFFICLSPLFFLGACSFSQTAEQRCDLATSSEYAREFCIERAELVAKRERARPPQKLYTGTREAKMLLRGLRVSAYDVRGRTMIDFIEPPFWGICGEECLLGQCSVVCF